MEILAQPNMLTSYQALVQLVKEGVRGESEGAAESGTIEVGRG